MNQSGLRRLILTRNRFSDTFARQLQKTMFIDKYLKVIDLAGNNIKEFGMKCMIKLALVENQSILNFDVRVNPGATEKIRR